MAQRVLQLPLASYSMMFGVDHSNLSRYRRRRRLVVSRHHVDLDSGFSTGGNGCRGRFSSKFSIFLVKKREKPGRIHNRTHSQETPAVHRDILVFIGEYGIRRGPELLTGHSNDPTAFVSKILVSFL